MPASRQSLYRERYAKLEEDSVAIVQARDFSKEELAQTAEDTFARVAGAVLVPIERISPNPDNPRRKITATALADLAASIAERGLLQPLVVRRNLDRVGGYVVIAGSRRLLAARLVHSDPDEAIRALVAVLPCLVREETARDAYADALLENLARADLSRAEMMEAIVRLNQEFGWSSHYIAKRTGRNQSDLAQLLSVARHPELAQLVRQEVIKPTVAGDINRLPEPERAAIIADVQAGTVRTSADVQRMARRLRPETPTSAGPTDPQTQDHQSAGVSDITYPKGPDAEGGRPISLIPRPAGAPPLDATDSNRVISLTPLGSAEEVSEQISAIGALVAMVDGETLAGQAVLKAVGRDLDAAYSKLAAYLKRQDTRTE